MSQHQQAFLADATTEVSRIARHALSVLADGKNALSEHPQSACAHGKSLSFKAQTQYLYAAAIAADPVQLGLTVQSLRHSGMKVSEILYDAIPAIARQLGDAWLSDSVSFTTVTIGCARLQSLLMQLNSAPAQTRSSTQKNRQSCLIIVPEGAQHTLGALVLSKQMRDAGTHVKLELDAAPAQISNVSRSQTFDAILISASKSESTETLREMVSATRHKAGQSKVIIGGGILEQNHDLVMATGTDYVTNDWQYALKLCL